MKGKATGPDYRMARVKAIRAPILAEWPSLPMGPTLPNGDCWRRRNFARQCAQKVLGLWFFPKMAQNDRVCDKSLFAREIWKDQNCAP
jgi:hypothetical protein